MYEKARLVKIITIEGERRHELVVNREGRRSRASDVDVARPIEVGVILVRKRSSGGLGDPASTDFFVFLLESDEIKKLLLLCLSLLEIGGGTEDTTPRTSLKAGHSFLPACQTIID
jgi:hypothetical protein